MPTARRSFAQDGIASGSGDQSWESDRGRPLEQGGELATPGQGWPICRHAGGRGDIEGQQSPSDRRA
jgi:hypothetical protein